MVHEPEEATLATALAGLVGRAAIGAAAALLALALLTELLRRRTRATRLIALLDAALPVGARTAAVSAIAVVAMFTSARPVAADDSVRGWLGHPTTSTTRVAAVVTPESVDELVDPAPTPAPLGPVILIPPAVEEQPSASPTSPPDPAAPSAPVPPPTEPVSAPTAYVVQPGDCLWSIAARQLGSQADGRAIDAGWRRIYEINRAAVGDNPSLIHPGLVLRLPPLDPQP